MSGPDTSRLQNWLNMKAAVKSRDDGLLFAPSAGVRMAGRGRWQVRARLYGTAWHVLTWIRWRLGRGPRCGDRYCWHPEDWPGGKVLLP